MKKDKKKLMEEIKLKNYRLATITKVGDNGFCQAPVSEGLALEKNIGDDYYMVILFIRPNGIEVTGDRLLEIEDNEWSIVKKLTSIGEQLVDLAKENEDND